MKERSGKPLIARELQFQGKSQELLTNGLTTPS